MDASKAIGIMPTNESDDLWDYVMFGTGKKQWPPMPSLPIVAITLQLPEQDQKLMEAV